jgi:hypothetical protein
MRRSFPRGLGLWLAAVCGCGAPVAAGGGDLAPARAVIPEPPPRSSEESRHEPLAAEAPICDPGEIETCVCADASTGGRRCNPNGTAFSPCDACPEGSSCGSRTCGAVRIAAINLTLPACCPERRPDACGIDVSFVAKNYGLSIGCLEFDAPGSPDSSCPSTELVVPQTGLVKFTGCHTPGGDCGYDVHVPDVIDLGCVNP